MKRNWLIVATLWLLPFMGTAADYAPTIYELRRIDGHWIIDGYVDNLFLEEFIRGVDGYLEDREQGIAGTNPALEDRIVSSLRNRLVIHGVNGLEIALGDGAVKAGSERSRFRLLIAGIVDISQPFKVSINSTRHDRKHTYIFRYKDWGQSIDFPLNQDNEFSAHVDVLRTLIPPAAKPAVERKQTHQPSLTVEEVR